MEKEQAMAQNKLEKAVARTKILTELRAAREERRKPGGPVKG